MAVGNKDLLSFLLHSKGCVQLNENHDQQDDSCNAPHGITFRSLSRTSHALWQGIFIRSQYTLTANGSICPLIMKHLEIAACETAAAWHVTALAD